MRAVLAEEVGAISSYGKCRDMRFTSAFALSTEVWPDSVHVGSAPSVTRSRCPHSPLLVLSLLAVHAFAVRALFVHFFPCAVRQRHKQPCARRNKTRNATEASGENRARARGRRDACRSRSGSSRGWAGGQEARGGVHARGRDQRAAGCRLGQLGQDAPLGGRPRRGSNCCSQVWGCSHEGPTEGIPWCPTDGIPPPWELSHRELPGVGLLLWTASTKSSGPRAAPSQC